MGIIFKLCQGMNINDYSAHAFKSSIIFYINLNNKLKSQNYHLKHSRLSNYHNAHNFKTGSKNENLSGRSFMLVA